MIGLWRFIPAVVSLTREQYLFLTVGLATYEFFISCSVKFL